MIKITLDSVSNNTRELSIMYPQEIVVENLVFNSTFAWFFYMLVNKSENMSDGQKESCFNGILGSRSSDDIWQLALRVHLYVDRLIDTDNESNIKECLRLALERKFQSDSLRERLYFTGDDLISEQSIINTIIFQCTRRSGELVGKNWCGELLMEIRENIKEDFIQRYRYDILLNEVDETVTLRFLNDDGVLANVGFINIASVVSDINTKKFVRSFNSNVKKCITFREFYHKMLLKKKALEDMENTSDVHTKFLKILSKAIQDWGNSYQMKSFRVIGNCLSIEFQETDPISIIDNRLNEVNGRQLDLKKLFKSELDRCHNPLDSLRYALDVLFM